MSYDLHLVIITGKFYTTTSLTQGAIDILNNVIENPERSFYELGRTDTLAGWKKKDNQTSELFNAKFSSEFNRFCMENGFCHETNQGINVPNQLALIYMSVLAHNIGDRKGISVITDTSKQREIARINNRAWIYNPDFEELKAMKKI